MPDANAAFIVLASVQAAATLLLTLITAGYAFSTRRLVHEAERARRESVRPLLIVEPGVESAKPSARELLDLGYLTEYEGKLPDCLDCYLSNAGAGPAVNVTADVRGPYGDFVKTLLHLPAHAPQVKWPLLLTPEGAGEEHNIRSARIQYEDVFGHPHRTVLRVQLAQGESVPRFTLAFE